MDQVRLDKWLWAARFFKTRALASEAVDGGKVELNGEKPKRAKQVRPGDRLRLRLGPYEHLLTVRAVSERRGPASVAATLYEEDPEGKRRRELLAEQHRLAPPAFDFGEGKPSKKQRRKIRQLRDQD
ncbi:MAG: S4 domain-containing protein [Gemmatimonadota bacterium]|jgi:ribosome-associated heat shock protein Hsp15|nr:S4 domain-containing protein [Gemmatimonadota bacterium]